MKRKGRDFLRALKFLLLYAIEFFFIFKGPKQSPVKTKTTYSLHCFIAGLQYYDVLEIWKELKIGDIVDLLPEPENHFDDHAVMVAYNGKQLGYVPRSQNRPIEKIHSAGLSLLLVTIEFVARGYNESRLPPKSQVLLTLRGCPYSIREEILWC